MSWYKKAQFDSRKMMPGQEPYNEDEYKKVQDLVGDAALEDPGEEYEEVYLRENAMKDVDWIGDQLLNAWEYMSEEEMFRHLNNSTSVDKTVLMKIITDFYDNYELRSNFVLVKSDIRDWIRNIINEFNDIE